MMPLDEETEPNGVNGNRRILKVRLRQDQVIRLHELRILRGRSIAHLLEDILDDYLSRQEFSTGTEAQKVGEKPPV